MTLNLAAVAEENQFQQEATVTIAEDGSYESEPFTLPAGDDEDDGNDGDIYRARFFVPLQPLDNFQEPERSFQFRQWGVGGEDVSILSSETVLAVQSDRVPAGNVLVEIDFGTGGEATEADRRAWIARRIESYRDWHTKMEKLQTRVKAQHEDGYSSPAAWQGFSEAFREDLQAHREALGEPDSIVDEHLMATPLDAIEEMFVALDDLQRQHQQKPAIVRLFSRMPEYEPSLTTAETKYTNSMRELRIEADRLEGRNRP